MHRLIEIAYAQIGGPPNIGLPSTPLPELLLQIVNAVLILVGVLALGMIVYGGFLYITAGGDDKQVGKAKTILTYAIIGVIVIGIAAALVTFVIDAVIGGQGGGGRGVGTRGGTGGIGGQRPASR